MAHPAHAHGHHEEHGSLSTYVTVFVALLILSLGLVAPAAAADPSITIHARLCPAGQPTTDIFTDCHPFAAEAGTRFKIDSGASKAIASNGNVTFGGLSSDRHVVRRTAGQGPNEFLHERVFCTWKDGTSKEIIPSSNGNFVVSLPGQSVTCDVYLIPESAA